MKIDVFCIQKSGDEFTQIEQFTKMSATWAQIVNINKFSQNIAKAQNISPKAARDAYEEAYLPHLNGFCIGLDERGEELNSLEFAKMLENRSQISFFIGGAYGFSESFKAKMHKLVSLSRLTIAYKIAKLMLFEQIYRALSISANHPYHK